MVESVRCSRARLPSVMGAACAEANKRTMAAMEVEERMMEDEEQTR